MTELTHHAMRCCLYKQVAGHSAIKQDVECHLTSLENQVTLPDASSLAVMLVYNLLDGTTNCHLLLQTVAHVVVC